MATPHSTIIVSKVLYVLKLLIIIGKKDIGKTTNTRIITYTSV